MITFTLLPGGYPSQLGFIPEFFSEDDPRPAREQIEENYAHGGGWRPLPQWKLLPNCALKYPGDPVLQPVAKAKLRDEHIVVYPYGIVMLLEPDGSYEVSRLD